MINDITKQLLMFLNCCAMTYIPKVKRNFSRPFCTEELSGLKKASMDAHDLWKLCDQPRFGIVNKIRLRASTDINVHIEKLP